MITSEETLDETQPDAVAAEEEEARLHVRAASELQEQLGHDDFTAGHQADGRLSLEQAAAEGLAED